MKERKEWETGLIAVVAYSSLVIRGEEGQLTKGSWKLLNREYGLLTEAHA